MVKVEPFRGYVAYSYYDLGSDLDCEDLWYVEITKDKVEFKRLIWDEVNLTDEEIAKAYDNYRVIHEKVFNKVDELIDRIRDKRCPLCNRKMKVIAKRRARKPYHGYALLKRYYPDINSYDEKSDYTFTCFKCGVKCSVHYDTWDGGAVLNWSYVIEKDGKSAGYSKTGYYNNERHFLMYKHFIEDLHQMGLLEVEENDTLQTDSKAQGKPQVC